MTEIKRIVCLANSRKLAGRCVAGREWAAEKGKGAWIRPVSERSGQEVSEYERQYEDGSDPRILDIIDLPLKEWQPGGFQTENWLLDQGHYWKKVGSYSPFELSNLADPVKPLWINGHSTYNGRNDKIPIAATSGIKSSLRLIYVEDLAIRVFAPGEAFGNSKRRVQGRFVHAGQTYSLWITDPFHEKRYLSKLDGTYRIDGRYLTISLGEPYGDAVYKLIAAIIGSDGR